MRSYPIYSDAELHEKGRTRESWNEMDQMIDGIHHTVYQKSSAKITSV